MMVDPRIVETYNVGKKGFIVALSEVYLSSKLSYLLLK